MSPFGPKADIPWGAELRQPRCSIIILNSNDSSGAIGAGGLSSVRGWEEAASALDLNPRSLDARRYVQQTVSAVALSSGRLVNARSSLPVPRSEALPYLHYISGIGFRLTTLAQHTLVLEVVRRQSVQLDFIDSGQHRLCRTALTVSFGSRPLTTSRKRVGTGTERFA
jgi:hypothetical protein